MIVTDGSETDVLIVGAGPVGLTLAIELVSRGVTVRIVDLDSGPVQASRGHAFVSRTLELFDTMGLAQQMLDAAQKPQPVALEFFDGELAGRHDWASGSWDPYPNQLAIWQQRVVRVLEASLESRGTQVEYSTRLTEFQADDHGVTTTLESPGGGRSVVRSKWLVGCDGSRSSVRKLAGVEFVGESSGHRYLICEADVDWTLSRDIFWVFQDGSGIAAAFFIDFTNKWHLIVDDLENAGARAGADIERLTALLRQRSKHDVQVTNFTRPVAVTLDQRIAERFMQGRVILAGDAAHVYAAAVGHGIHGGVGDAVNLGWKLALTLAGHASPGLLATYEDERAGHARDVTTTTGRFSKAINPRSQNRYRLTFKLWKARRSMVAPIAEQADSLDSHYEASALTRPFVGDAVGRARPGLHVPAPTCRSGGRPSSLFEIVRGTPADLLMYVGSTPTKETLERLRQVENCVAPLQELIRVHYVFPSDADPADFGLAISDENVVLDSLQQLQDAMGWTEPELVYVRPDAFIGLRTRELSPAALFDYLSAIYSPQVLQSGAQLAGRRGG